MNFTCGGGRCRRAIRGVRVGWNRQNSSHSSFRRVSGVRTRLYAADSGRTRARTVDPFGRGWADGHAAAASCQREGRPPAETAGAGWVRSSASRESTDIAVRSMRSARRLWLKAPEAPLASDAVVRTKRNDRAPSAPTLYPSRRSAAAMTDRKPLHDFHGCCRCFAGYRPPNGNTHPTMRLARGE